MSQIFSFSAFIFSLSKEYPEWFNIFPEQKQAQLKEYLAKNEESIQILSKHQGWIHVSPKTNNRSNPLEKKTLDEEKHRKILPNWMNIKIDKKQKDLFKSYPNILINKNNIKKIKIFIYNY